MSEEMSRMKAFHMLRALMMEQDYLTCGERHGRGVISINIFTSSPHSKVIELFTHWSRDGGIVVYYSIDC